MSKAPSGAFVLCFACMIMLAIRFGWRESAPIFTPESPVFCSRIAP
ncbi:hypothetical protein Msip34_2241 [Methylovorus glucosotrophus SIP3-4]|uniref:Uncharacterized protein n=1 Tax=Methylovorus glucosotrophus (strain SIP3-4) TaxID=582744 RepID=C6X9U2_METGS|nr:hypothetical protein Msip34_2241 [Methylovorus glucosotrophus SIP3-4]